MVSGVEGTDWGTELLRKSGTQAGREVVLRPGSGTRHLVANPLGPRSFLPRATV